MKALIDLDFVKYAVASIGEDRFIDVTHIPSKRVKRFKTRTEFYGHHSKKEGGWLSETNFDRVSKGLPPFNVGDFHIEDGREVKEPLENVLHSAKLVVEGALKESGATSFEAFIGEGDGFRVGMSTLLEYKGNRKNLVKPLLIDDVSQYLRHKYSATVVKDVEVDDIVTTLAYNKPDVFVIGVDKDYYGSPIQFFNVNRPNEGIVDCTGFGRLWLDDSGKVRGTGRLFRYFQVISEDDSDNYCANCLSMIKWGAKSAYKTLKDCTNDEDALSSMVKVFQMLYPERKQIMGWRGDELIIDWLYVMQECFDMAHLQRWKGDRVNVKELLTKFGILTKMKVLG